MTEKRKKELIREAHEVAKEKGWWDEPRTNEECFALILSEACEALEADRKGMRASGIEAVRLLNYLPDGMPSDANGDREDWCRLFATNIKDTVEDELADVCIRCFDLAATIDYCDRMPLYGDFINPKSMVEYVLHVAGRCSWAVTDKERMFSPVMPEAMLENIVFATMAMAHPLGIDLWRHIELKMAYNKTRPRKHGKNY